MKVKPKTVKRDVTLMVDPAPTHLSVVNHGANQSPFKAVKSQQEISDMAKSQASKEPVVKFITLSKGQFPETGDVTTYLTAKDWDPDSYTVEDDDDVWIARSTEQYHEGYLAPKTRSVATKDEGVFMHIAEVIGTGNVAKDAVNVNTKKPKPNTQVDGESDQSVTTEEIPGAPKKGKPGATDSTGQGKDLDDSLVANPTVTGDSGSNAKKVKAKPGSVAKADVKPEVVPDEEGNDADGESGQEVTEKPIPGATGTSKRAKASSAKIGEGDDALLIARYGAKGNAKKYDCWMSMYSDDLTLGEVLEDGMSYDHLPPGVEEVLEALETATGNVLGSSDITDKTAALRGLADEFVRITVGLYNLFKVATVELKSEPAQKWADSFKASIIKASNGAEKVEEAGEGELDPGDTETDMVPDPTSTGDKSSKSIAKQIEESLAAGFATVKKELTEQVNALQSQVTSLKSELGNVAKEVDENLSATPTRKSMADAFEELTDPDGERTSKKAEADAITGRARAALGWRR